MRKLWVLLQKRKSAGEVVALLTPIVIAAAGGVWAVFTYAFPADRPGGGCTPAGNDRRPWWCSRRKGYQGFDSQHWSCTSFVTAAAAALRT